MRIYEWSSSAAANGADISFDFNRFCPVQEADNIRTCLQRFVCAGCQYLFSGIDYCQYV